MFPLSLRICYYVLFVITLIKDNIYKTYGMKKPTPPKDVWRHVWKEEEDRKAREMATPWSVVWGDSNWTPEVAGPSLEFQWSRFGKLLCEIQKDYLNLDNGCKYVQSWR